MRRLVAWIAGAVGGLAVWRLLNRRHGVAPQAPHPPEPAPESGPDPRAEELRAKLAGSRVEEADAAPEPPAAAADGDGDPDERRRRVHEAGRAALDEMHGAE